MLTVATPTATGLPHIVTVGAEGGLDPLKSALWRMGRAPREPLLAAVSVLSRVVANILQPPWAFVLLLVLMISKNGLKGEDMHVDDQKPASSFAAPFFGFLLFMVAWQLVLRDVWDALSGQSEPTKKAVPGVDSIAKLPTAGGNRV